jgi:DNA ligase-associated metallophosphoesterase
MNSGIATPPDPQAIALAGETLHLLPSGAALWPATGTLVVADLHLGKSERRARRWGALLPPYDTAETLARLDAVLDATRPATVLCLGDSFDDSAAADALEDDMRLWLARMMAGRRWIWVAGNHDPAPVDVGGTSLAEHRAGALTFRHIAQADADPGEVSGHWHPKLRLPVAGAGAARPAFLADAQRLILPAFGAYTGGLSALDPALSALMAPDAVAVLTGRAMVRVPLAACHSAAASSPGPSSSGRSPFRSPAASARSR